MASFVAIGVLGLLFMLVFAIIGLHVFGGALPSEEFPNFNTFFNAFLSVFQLLTVSSCMHCVHTILLLRSLGACTASDAPVSHCSWRTGKSSS